MKRKKKKVIPVAAAGAVDQEFVYIEVGELPTTAAASLCATAALCPAAAPAVGDRLHGAATEWWWWWLHAVLPPTRISTAAPRVSTAAPTRAGSSWGTASVRPERAWAASAVRSAASERSSTATDGLGLCGLTATDGIGLCRLPQQQCAVEREAAPPWDVSVHERTVCVGEGTWITLDGA